MDNFQFLTKGYNLTHVAMTNEFNTNYSYIPKLNCKMDQATLGLPKPIIDKTNIVITFPQGLGLVYQ